MAYTLSRRISSLLSPLRSSCLRSQILKHSTEAAPSNSARSNTSAFSTVAPWLFFGTPVILTFSLGVWQVKRLERKNNLIHERQLRLEAEPLSSSQFIEAVNSVDPTHLVEDMDFRTVHLRGRFLHDQEQFVSPRSAPKNMPHVVLHWGGSSGMQVITPCVLESGDIILINRGWIPHRLTQPEKRLTAVISPSAFRSEFHGVRHDQRNVDAPDVSVVDFVGVIRLTHERNRFTPDNVPSENSWYYIDPPEMLRNCQLPSGKQLPVLVELVEPLPSNGWPFPRTLDQFVDFRTPPSTHVTYAVTWFSLGIALALLGRSRILQTWRSERKVATKR